MPTISSDMFFATESLVTQSLQPCEPWTFQLIAPISAQIRGCKEDRQRWYRDPDTRHNFYTAIEGVNPMQRISKNNPPRALNGFVADYDVKVPAERIAEVIASMDLKPTYFETSLGGNFRFVWLLEKPLPVDDKLFCVFILKEAHDWLRLGLLPLLDRQAFEDPARLYCNGGVWEATDAGPIPAARAQAFFVECGKKFRFKAGDDELVPLDIVEKALHERYPNFSWPGPFELETQGPSFWVPGSTSPQSAIVKNGGMFSFAGHASKPFYSWSDLLGKEFTKDFQEEAVAKATEDIWWDGKKFWAKEKGIYRSMEKAEMASYFKVTCRLSSKSGQNGISPMEAAFEHIFRHQYVAGAAPFVFRPPGLLIFDKERKLNTYSGQPIQPADQPQKWGEHGNFPFISKWLDSLFDPVLQRDYFLAWFKHYYTSALNFCPYPGQNIFLLGGPATGKTLCNRSLIGVAVGGFVDASDFLVQGATFNSHLLKKGHWVLDDDSPIGSAQATARVHMMFKKIAANQEFICNTKFETSTMVAWAGRIGCTANLDFVSMRIVGPLDEGVLGKISLFRCVKKSLIVFPPRAELANTISIELPFFLRALLDWEPPDEIERDNRYGYAAFHEKSLLDQTSQGSFTASFKEILIEFLTTWFRDNPSAKYWEGTVSMIVQALVTSASTEFIMRSLKLEHTSRYLEQMQKEKLIECEVRQGAHNTRIWRFHRF